MRFEPASAWALLALLPVLLLLVRRRRHPSALIYPSLAVVGSLPRTLTSRLRWLPAAIRALLLILLVVAVARPQRADERADVRSEGIAIELIIDVSGSMEAMDLAAPGASESRLDVVKQVVRDFVLGKGDLPGRRSDLLGAVAFASHADAICPLTLDHEHLVMSVEAADIPAREDERATAIGDALALAVERLSALDPPSGATRSIEGGQTAPPVKSRVIVLLTDGESNAGEMEPLVSADLAAALGMRVYTIGVGTDRGWAPVPAIDPFTGRRVTQRVPVSIDEGTLRAIAQRTGALYFRATDRASLERIYAQIDAMERTELRTTRFTDYLEWAIRPLPGVLSSIGFGGALPPVLLVVVALLLVEMILRATRFWRLC